MAKLIDITKTIRDLTAMKSMYDAISLDGMIKALKDASAMELVHCAECTRAKHCKMRFFMEGYYRIKDPFCAAGERREGE